MKSIVYFTLRMTGRDPTTQSITKIYIKHFKKKKERRNGVKEERERDIKNRIVQSTERRSPLNRRSIFLFILFSRPEDLKRKF